MIASVRRWRRRRLLARPFPDGWEGIIRRNVRHARALSPDLRQRHLDLTRVIEREIYWESAGGLDMNEEISVTIAAQTAVLILGLNDDRPLRRVKTVIVYPAAYLVPHYNAGTAGVVLGQAHYRGPVILSWANALAGVRGQANGHNVVLHEFAHKLDMLDGWIDGTPPLSSKTEVGRWQEVMTAEFLKLRSDAERGRMTLLDTYGATNEAEFFAVATEAFFERAGALKQLQPDLYDILRRYYGQDPANWMQY